jgi:hypothetical protein
LGRSQAARHQVLVLASEVRILPPQPYSNIKNRAVIVSIAALFFKAKLTAFAMFLEKTLRMDFFLRELTVEFSLILSFFVL